MCGIVGCTGLGQAVPYLMTALGKLAYRGYDSAGIAVLGDGKIRMVRAAGKLPVLAREVGDGTAYPGTCGIGHTRWATHGEPSARNAHPHGDGRGTVAVVHNGIIDNFRALRREMETAGEVFLSDTDTEVIPHLLAAFRRAGSDPAEAVLKTAARLVGSFALAILFADRPGEIYGIRRDPPLLVATCPGGGVLASDYPALLDVSDRVREVPPDCVVCLSPSGVRFWDSEAKPVEVPEFRIPYTAAQAERGGYATFMEKEIREVPRAIRDTLRAAEDGVPGCPPPDRLAKIRQICFVGCGSAYHIGLAGEEMAERAAGIPARAMVASEFRYREMPISEDTLVVAVSQSGETADTLAAVRYARGRGAYVWAVVNVVGSGIARAADGVFYTVAGPEIAVATTKAYAAQYAAVALICGKLGEARGRPAGRIGALSALPDAAAEVIARWDTLRKWAREMAPSPDIFFIGRGGDYAACLEGSLKLKEISYRHAEAYAAGELKHGTISLITHGTPVVAVLTQPALFVKTLGNVEEVRCRGAAVFALVAADLAVPEGCCHWFRLPPCEASAAPLVAVVAMQILAYETALALSREPDTPRNLAKSVTVE